MQVYSRAVDLMEAELGSELVALDAEAGTCFGFNEVATSVWRLLAEPQTLQQLCSTLSQQYVVEQQECKSDVSALLEELVRAGLVRETASPKPDEDEAGERKSVQ